MEKFERMKNMKHTVLVIALFCGVGLYMQYHWSTNYYKVQIMSEQGNNKSNANQVQWNIMNCLNLSEVTEVLNVHKQVKSEIEKPDEQSIPKNLSPNMSEIAEERSIHLQTMCKKLGYGYNNGTLSVSTWMGKPMLARPRLYYSDKHKIVVCGVPKCGSTEWRKALLIVEGDVNTTLPSEIEHEYAFTQARKKRFLWERFQGKTPQAYEEMNKRLNNYYRIMTVREPLERVVSAYIDKMLSGGSGETYYKGHSERIHKNFAPNKNSPSFKPGRATFEEFVDSIINNPGGLDIHWKLYNGICDPCHMQYNYIAKLETISLDSEFLSMKSGIENQLLFPRNSNASVSLEHKWKDKYSVYLEKLPPKKLHDLYLVYREQYKLFNYPPPPIL
ncbi:carbohydrate sulfotransferase 10-like isoform X3 [Styela clava]|uniref:carbohydrate sulfotransferase 10-like isoform X2 n=1 Tax=Styela clava TaxID=7725 RepID=UPI00193A4EB6|nr:carbohydrate sulfotransferase 10-like isoform X2 [Styela clava]